MALDDDDITTSGGGGEGTADGGSNPEGHDGGADGPQQERRAKVRPTAAPIPRVTTAGPTERRDRFSMLSRCVGRRYRVVRDPVLGPAAPAEPSGRAAPRLQRSAVAVCRRRADRRARGTRAVHPHGQGAATCWPELLPRAGRLRRRDARPGGLGQGAGRVRAGATIVLQGLHRLWPPLIDFVRCMVDDLGHPRRRTPMSPRRQQRLRPPLRRPRRVRPASVGPEALDRCTSRCISTRCLRNRGPSTATRSTNAVTASRSSIPSCTPAMRFICRAVGFMPRRRMDATSIHLTIGVSPLTTRRSRAVVETLAGPASSEGRCRWPSIPPTATRWPLATSKIAAQVVDTVRSRAAELSDAAAHGCRRRHAERTRPVRSAPWPRWPLPNCDCTSVRWRRGLLAHRRSDGRVVLRLPDRTVTFPATCAPA